MSLLIDYLNQFLTFTEYNNGGAREANFAIGDPAYNLFDTGTSHTNYANVLISAAPNLFPNKIVGAQILRTILGGYDNCIGTSIMSGILSGDHSVVEDSATGHSFICGGGGSRTTYRAGVCTILGSQYTTLSGFLSSTVGCDACQMPALRSLTANSMSCMVGLTPPESAGTRITATTVNALSGPVVGDTITVVSTSGLGSVSATGVKIYTNVPNIQPNGVVGAGQTITGASWSSSVVTFTVSNSYTVGQLVSVTGMTPAAYNGVYTVVTASGTQFTAAKSVDPGTATAFGKSATIPGAGYNYGVVAPSMTPIVLTVTITSSTVLTITACPAASAETAGVLLNGLVFLAQAITATSVNMTNGPQRNDTIDFASASIFGSTNDVVEVYAATGTMSGESPTIQPTVFTCTVTSSTRLTIQSYAPTTWFNEPNIVTGAYVFPLQTSASRADYNTLIGCQHCHTIAPATQNTIVGGYNCRADFNHFYTNSVGLLRASNTFMWGRNNQTNAPYQSAVGHGARPINPGQHTKAHGWFAKPGDAQASEYVLRTISSLANTTVYLKAGQGSSDEDGDLADNASSSGYWVALKGNTSVLVEALVTGYSMTDGLAASYRLTAHIITDSTGDATVFNVVNTVLYEHATIASAWTANIVVFDALGGSPVAGLGIEVTDDNSRVVRWLAHVRTVEIGF